MKTQPTHTPTLELKQDPNCEWDLLQDGEIVVCMVNPADWEPIVRAVNCHEELLGALIDMQAQAGRTGPDAKRALERAYKAIASAEGRE